MTIDIVSVIISEVVDIVTRKGYTAPIITIDSNLFDGTLPIDSLDIASIIIKLEELFDDNPLVVGFNYFQTVGDLACFYKNEAMH